ncbi:MAG: CoA-binding protein [Dehalococcoidia bacterium]
MSEAAGSTAKNLDRAFNPRSVAVVGDKRALGYMWLRSMSPFKGRVYSVQIDPGELPGIAELGVENYLSLLDIPGPVDYVIAAVPRAVAPGIVEDCIKKEVGGVSFFTSGFAETNTEEGIRLQQVIADMARKAGLNLIGPNCVGLYNPEIGLRHAEAQEYGEPGSVGFIAQSGTHATLFSIVGSHNGIKVSKSVSYGNAVVLDSTDFLEYLGADEGTRIIGMYIEGVRDGRRFFRCLREVASRKPVFIWKGGETGAGARAASSHTGVLAESGVVWQAVIRQCGAVKVDSLEEMIDAIKLLLYVEPAIGTRVGLIAMSGGQAVAITDTFAREGLEVPLLTDHSYQRLASFFDIIGGSYRNPFDISSTFLLSSDPISNLRSMLDVMDQDPNIDCIVLELFPITVPLGRDAETEYPVLDTISDFKEKSRKPFMVILTAEHGEALALEMRDKLVKRGIPSFHNFERAAKTLRKLADHYQYRKEQLHN